MTKPSSLTTSDGRKTWPVVGDDNVGRHVRGIGDFTPAGADDHTSHLGVATHLAGDAVTATAPVVLLGVVDAAGDVAAMTQPRTPTTFVPLSAVDISSEATVWTPAGGKKFRLLGYVITQGTLTGDVILRDDTAGTTILVIPAQTVGIAQVSPPLGDGILSATADHVLTAEGESTETISGYLFGVEE